MFQYSVKWFDDGFHEARGLIGGCETYAEAVRKLTDYYGEAAIVSFTIESISEDAFVLEYTTDTFDINSVAGDY